VAAVLKIFQQFPIRRCYYHFAEALYLEVCPYLLCPSLCPRAVCTLRVKAQLILSLLRAENYLLMWCESFHEHLESVNLALLILLRLLAWKAQTVLPLHYG
jgi:hypothetical protein